MPKEPVSCHGMMGISNNHRSGAQHSGRGGHIELPCGFGSSGRSHRLAPAAMAQAACRREKAVASASCAG